MITYCTEPATKNARLKNHKLTQSEARAKPELQAVAAGILRKCADFFVGISNSFEKKKYHVKTNTDPQFSHNFLTVKTKHAQNIKLR